MLRRCPNLRRYVANVVEPPENRPEASPGGILAFDAVDELWLDSLENGIEAVLADESDAGLIDSLVGYHVAEHVQRAYQRPSPAGDRSPGRKMLSPLRRAEGFSHEEFVEGWLRRHVPLALTHILGMGGYVTNVVLAPLTSGAPEVDGIVEVYYVEKRRFDSPEGEALLMEDTRRLLTPPTRHWVSEHVVREP